MAIFTMLVTVVSQLPRKMIAYITLLVDWLGYKRSVKNMIIPIIASIFFIQIVGNVWEDLFIHEIRSWKKNELVIIPFSF